MRLEEGKISSSQLVFLAIGFFIGTSILIPPGNSAGRDTWLAILVGLAEALILLGLYLSVARKYPDRTWVEINTIILGPWVGSLTSLIFIWYTFHAGAMELRIMGEFMDTIMVTTPIDVFMLLIALVCAYAASKGIEVMSRCAVILVSVFVAFFVFDTFIAAPLIDLTNLLPFMDIPVKKFLQSAHSAATYPLAEILVFFMILPFLNRTKEGPGSLLKGMVIAGCLLMLEAVRNAAVLANLNPASTFPTLSVVSLINIGDVLNRMDILVALDLITMGFVKVSLFYYTAILGLAQVLKMRSYRPLIVPLAVFMYLLGMSSFNNGINEIETYAVTGWPYYSIPFLFIIPLLLLLVGIIRKFPPADKTKGEPS